MKKYFSSLILLLFVCNLNAQTLSKRKIQLVILFDTSNSMDGLIDQAKSKIWSIVNEVSNLKYNGETPTLEMAMYDYGNSGISSQYWIRQQLNFTKDLDLVSEKLFGLRTNGGEEYCGAVIKQSIRDLSWSNDKGDLKLIYIAGNEPFNQGPVSYKEVCQEARNKDILVNTIYCGDYDQGVRENWKDGATCSNGAYFNINSNEKVAFIQTPYDDEINNRNRQLNGTYLWYGSDGYVKKAQQEREDNNSSAQGASVAAERSIAKSKANYKNEGYDLLDAIQADSTVILKMKEEDLPKEFKGKTDAEKREIIAKKQEERAKIQKEIGDIAKKREEFIQEERKKNASNTSKDDFGTAVAKNLKENALKKGFE